MASGRYFFNRNQDSLLTFSGETFVCETPSVHDTISGRYYDVTVGSLNKENILPMQEYRHVQLTDGCRVLLFDPFVSL